MFNFSEHGIKDVYIYSKVYKDFIEWCKTKVRTGTFSTYVDGEPVCFSKGIEISYREYLANQK